VTKRGSGGKRELLVVGDRILIRLEDGEERTKVGLYLPATAVDGPGYPLPAVEEHLDEPWKISGTKETRYVPMQARVGDYALFFRKAAVEITFENERYLVVPQAAILTLARDH
jgi:chaperonin GroES